MGEREHLQRVCELASLNMNAADTSADLEQFMILKTLADEARINLDRATSELLQHRDRHVR
jgi:hypothetical protein